MHFTCVECKMIDFRQKVHAHYDWYLHCSFGSNQRLSRTCFVIFPHKAYIIREIQERPNQSNMSWLCWLLYYILVYRSVYKASLTQPLLIKVPVPVQESGGWCICVLFVSVLPLWKVLDFLDFAIASTVLYCIFIFHFFTDTINITPGLLA